MSNFQHLAVFVFLIFLPMGRGVFCNLLLFIMAQFLALSFNHIPPAVSLSYYLQWRTSIVKLKPKFDKFSYLRK